MICIYHEYATPYNSTNLVWQKPTLEEAVGFIESYFASEGIIYERLPDDDNGLPIVYQCDGERYWLSENCP